MCEASRKGNGMPKDSDLWVTYSMNKEDMWVAHIPVPIQTEAHSHADGSRVPSVGNCHHPFPPNWNIHSSPVYAPVSLNDGWLTLTDSDPFDYARVESKIPATKELKVSFDLLQATEQSWFVAN